MEEWSGKRGVGVGEWRRGLQYEIMVQSSMVRTDPYQIFFLYTMKVRIISFLVVGEKVLYVGK